MHCISLCDLFMFLQKKELFFTGHIDRSCGDSEKSSMFARSVQYDVPTVSALILAGGKLDASTIISIPFSTCTQVRYPQEMKGHHEHTCRWPPKGLNIVPSVLSPWRRWQIIIIWTAYFFHSQFCSCFFFDSFCETRFVCASLTYCINLPFLEKNKTDKNSK